jgi:AraC-like DNA-binding protein
VLADMKAILPRDRTGRLERLCGRRSGNIAAGAGRIRIGAGAVGIERLEAHFLGQAFSPHRHDTYAIGVTLLGVQTFRYRGEQRYCLPGHCHILHPDETHDGGSGTDDGFGYRIIYVDPWLIQEAIGGKPLPFVRCPVVDVARLPRGFVASAWNIDREIDDIARIEIAVMVADMLLAAVPDCMMTSSSLAIDALSRVRDLIAAHPAARHSMDELERLSGLDRWTLARQFRAAFGTSPSRFRTMRQLDHVRRLLTRDMTLAEASIEAGFADQSHMSRRFKNAYGITAGYWVEATV